MDDRPPKSKGFFQSVCVARGGSVYGFRTEKNCLTYMGICTSFFVINLLCHVTMLQHVVFIVCLGGVFSSEMINTAIEHIMDLYTPELHPEVKIIKDLAAAGVWMWGGAFFIMEGIYICHALFK